MALMQRLDASVGHATFDISAEAPLASMTDDTVPATSVTMQILLWIYLAGIVATALWTLAVAWRLHRIIASGHKTKCQGYTLVRLDRGDIAPFSWGRYIVLGPDEEAESMEMIVRHEQAHIEARHYMDLILAQAVCIVLWYNPAAWLMLAEMKAVHEYQADQNVLTAGIDARRYQLLLIKKAVGARFPTLANSLNHSKLKKRITMMYNRKTSPVRRMRALALLPAAALALALVNIPAVSGAMERASSTSLVSLKNSEAKVTDNATDMQMPAPENTIVQPAAQAETSAPDKLPEYPGGEMALMKYLMNSVVYPKAAEKAGAEGKVVVGFNVNADGSISDIKIIRSVSPDLDAEALRVVKDMKVKWTPGESGGKKVTCAYALPIHFKLAPSKKK